MNDFLSGYNFARQSDVVFSETISENKTHKTYIVDSFELDDGDIIFCKIDNVLKLFEILKNEEELKNIKLITHEGDYSVTSELFALKPKCISKWYAQNVDYEHENLIAIPIGLANDYCSITLKYDKLIREGNPSKLLYINNRIENYQGRRWICEYFETNNWCTVDPPNLSLEQYKTQLDNHRFILCPRGNGIDTHRLWESLYHGIIPIVETHIQYKCLKDLPAIVVNSFKEITEEFLTIEMDNFSQKKFNMDKLKTSWWIECIKKDLLNNG
jgi:hypothetical protein